MNLSQTRQNLTKFDHTKLIQANLNQTKHNQNLSKSLVPTSFCEYVLSHTNSQVQIETHKLDQTKVNINGFGMAKSAAQLLYGPVLVSVY